MYLVSTPWIVRKFYNDRIWDIETREKIIYLSFDDGPHEIATPFVLDQLHQFNAKATFFCIGKNVLEHPDLFKRIIDEGHSIGNHTNTHLNGWEVPDNIYIKDIYEAKKIIPGNMFRPPYGRIKKFQIKLMEEADLKLKIIMWSVLSGDFDLTLSGEKCFENVINNTKKGSIVVFHDSSKAFSRLEYALPKVLEHFTAKGFIFKRITID